MKKPVSTAEQELWKKSFSFFEKGIGDFEAIGDKTNTALLLCNTGRLMRICAQAHCTVMADESRGEFSPEEALYYNKVPFSNPNHWISSTLTVCFNTLLLFQAIDYYLSAMRSLGSREIHPAVWDSVNWELSTTYFTLATLLQDFAPLSRKAQEQVS